MPSVGEIPRLVDRFVPGLLDAIQEQDPVVTAWPRQVSRTGFGHALIRKIQIPDGDWRGSRWCLVCGPASREDERFVMGIVTVFDAPNSMDLIRVDNEGEWPAVVRVARSSADN